jgi:hypothetical protein
VDTCGRKTLTVLSVGLWICRLIAWVRSKNFSFLRFRWIASKIPSHSIDSSSRNHLLFPQNLFEKSKYRWFHSFVVFTTRLVLELTHSLTLFRISRSVTIQPVDFRPVCFIRVMWRNEMIKRLVITGNDWTLLGGNRPKIMSLYCFQDLKEAGDPCKQTLQAKMF